MQNVVVMSFESPQRAHDAMEELRRLDGERLVEIRNAAVVERDHSGDWVMPEQTETASYKGAVAGGVIGALLGMLAGPAGALLGGAGGAIVGSGGDMEDDVLAGAIEGTFPLLVTPGTTALVADLEEPDPAVLDQAMTAVGARITRIPRARLEADLIRADEAVKAREAEAGSPLL